MESLVDTVNRERLVGQPREEVRDRKTLTVIHRYLTAGMVFPDCRRELPPRGVP